MPPQYSVLQSISMLLSRSAGQVVVIYFHHGGTEKIWY